ncbi:hypothetical protein J0A68_16010 [Algoriphagus sp. H41]|uniref:Glycoside hydrolase family 2 catalytic domain-containing protein n=1 Tax=Algoriphagus oliviformis TaxID=2811231 RepID=A0ABS3C7B4_9BACT|nr:glycoside hydrolase family 2 TIM barrel-domain containing protein [Algoriphagus oliviformis]MBN7812459.1 hypothetical protein [Algoriphagus oliviformis]
MKTNFERHKLVTFFIALFLFCACDQDLPKVENPTVEVRYQDGKAQLYRHGEPYYIKGAAGTEHLDLVAEYGGNSIRTWSLHDADRILDEAHAKGLTVTLGLEVGRPSWGNDFSYWKYWEVDRKIEELRPLIEKYKDHPALLMWGVGNEVKEYGGGPRPVVFYIIDQVARMIKEVDPNHPTMTAVDVFSSQNKVASYRHVMPHIDILGFNAFKTIDQMYERVYEDKGWGKAFIVSEWGPDGHWEIPATEWGAPKEMRTAEKIQVMKEYWDKIASDSSLLLGSYAFYWGHKYEATHTWFSVFSEDGSKTELANFLRYAWSKEQAENSAPDISNIFIETAQGPAYDNVYLENNTEYIAKAFTEDLEGDSLTYRWEIRHEGNYFIEVKGYDYNMTGYTMEHLIDSVEGDSVRFKTPKEEGPYRIFAFAYDQQGNVASYNVPFYVVMK